MKKVYVKPEIELEQFQFTSNIAGTCNKVLTPEEIEQDKLNGGFVDDSCPLISCYHVPEGNTVLAS